jgi:uncharacterized membrane-anchored protein
MGPDQRVLVLLMRMGHGTEAFYWLAIIFLRPGATNVGDGLIHIFGLSFGAASLLTGVATLVAGFFTLPPFAGAISPPIDPRYWLAMGIGGVFGTVFGDLTAHTVRYVPGPDRARRGPYRRNPVRPRKTHS